MRARITFIIIIRHSFQFHLSGTNFFENTYEEKSPVDFALSGNWDFQAAAIQQPGRTCWAGPVKNLIDPFGYGGYYILMYMIKPVKS